MNILYSILELTFIAAMCESIAGLAISLGKWKTKMGILPRFKDQDGKQHTRRFL